MPSSSDNTSSRTALWNTPVTLKSHLTGGWRIRWKDVSINISLTHILQEQKTKKVISFLNSDASWCFQSIFFLVIVTPPLLCTSCDKDQIVFLQTYSNLKKQPSFTNAVINHLQRHLPQGTTVLNLGKLQSHMPKFPSWIYEKSFLLEELLWFLFPRVLIWAIQHFLHCTKKSQTLVITVYDLGFSTAHSQMEDPIASLSVYPQSVFWPPSSHF